MAIAGPIVEYEWAWGGVTYSLFAKDAAGQDILVFLPTLVLVAEVSRAPQAVAVGGHTRRRYPGGPAISVSGFSRTTLQGGRANRRTLPGQNAFFEREVEGPSGPVTDVVTVSHTGPYTALYQFASDTATIAYRLRSQDGTVDEIAVSGV